MIQTERPVGIQLLPGPLSGARLPLACVSAGGFSISLHQLLQISPDITFSSRAIHFQLLEGLWLFFLTTLLIPVMFRRVESPAGSPVVLSRSLTPLWAGTTREIPY